MSAIWKDRETGNIFVIGHAVEKKSLLKKLPVRETQVAVQLNLRDLKELIAELIADKLTQGDD